MRVMPFIQVLLLLLLLSYLLFVALENPGVIHLPLPFGRGEYIAPIGTTITAFLLAGGIYSSILFLPVLIQKHTQYLNERREKKATQQRLAQSLQARLGAVPRTNHLIAEELIETPTPPTMPIIEYTMPPAPAVQAPPAPPITEPEPPEPKVNLEKPHDRSQSNIEILAEPEPEPVKVDLTRPDDYKRISDDVARSLEEYLWQEETQATKKEMEEILVQTKMAVALYNFDSKCEFFGFGSTQYDRKHLEAAFNTDKPDIQSFTQAPPPAKPQEQEKNSDSKPQTTLPNKENKEHEPKSKPKKAKIDLTRPVSLKRPPRNRKKSKPKPTSSLAIQAVKTKEIPEPTPTIQTATNTNLDQDKENPVLSQPTTSHHATDLIPKSESRLEQEPVSTNQHKTDLDAEFGFEEFSFDLDQFNFNLDHLAEYDPLTPSNQDNQPEKSKPDPDLQQENLKRPEAPEDKSKATVVKASKNKKFSIKKNKEKIKAAPPQQHQKISLIKKTQTSSSATVEKTPTKSQVTLSKSTPQSTDAKLSRKKPTDDISANATLASQESEPPMPQESQQSVQLTKGLKATEQ